MVEGALTDLSINMVAAGLTSGTRITTRKAYSLLRQEQVSTDLNAVATEFYKALEGAIEEENDHLDSNELAEFTDEWGTIADELAATSATPDATSRRDAEEIDVLFVDEEEAVRRIAEAYATVEGFNLDEMSQLRDAMEDALTRAYRRGVSEFETRIADTELADRFEAETNLVLVDRLNDLQNRLTAMEADLTRLLSQNARNEGFRQLSPAFFARQTVSPETCWRVGFSLADVEAGLAAERDGLDTDPASEELLGILHGGENRMVVGRPGSGKSTLCKRVAVRWYEADDLGDILYRESGNWSPFESTHDLAQAIERAETPVLVVVEDAVRESANAIATVMEEFEADSDVRFLLDARQEEFEEFEGTGSLDVRANRRQGAIVRDTTRYQLPSLSVDDVERVCSAFEDATGRVVRQDVRSLRDQVCLDGEEDLGIGEMLVLAFFLPATDDEQESGGLEDHVRARYETLEEPGSEGALRELTEFDAELLADVGVMVNLLNASGIGIHQELVHVLAYEYGHDIDTHDEIEAVLESLEGWFLFPVKDDGMSWTTHQLWSTLYLREIALNHAIQQATSRRRDRPEPRTGRCLESLFRLFDNEIHRESLANEFPASTVLEIISEEPRETAEECLDVIFLLGEAWPVLAPLFGTTRTAQYEFPETASDLCVANVWTSRGHAHFMMGSNSKARSEYEYRLEKSCDLGDRQCEANSLNNLGLVDRAQGEYEKARENHEESLNIYRDLGDRQGEANSLGNLGLVAHVQGGYNKAREYYEESLAIFRDLGDRQGEANSLNNLGLVNRRQGGYENARKYYEESLVIFRDLGDRQGEANSLNNLGLIADVKGEYEKAREYYEKSLAIKRDLGNRQNEAASLNNIGVVARKKGEYEKSRKCHQESLTISRDLGDRHGEAKSLGNLGAVAARQGEYVKAREYHEESLAIFCDLGDRRGEAESLDSLGLVARGQGESEKAQKYHAKSLAISRDLGDRQGEANSLGNLGLVTHVQGEYQRAQDCYEESLAISRDLGDRQGEANNVGNLGLVTYVQGEYEKAREYYEESLAISRDLGDRQGEAESLGNLGLVAQVQGEYEKAREYIQPASDLFQQLGAIREEMKTRRQLIRLELQRENIVQASKRCAAARERIGELDRNLSDEREQLESLCENVSEE